MDKDLLVILKPDFTDPAYPGQRFYCWHCALIEGVLASCPELSQAIDVERIAWPRPRQRLVDLIGDNNQSAPVLILAENTQGTEKHFITDVHEILRVLSERHQTLKPHP
ncbi:MAG: DUF3088 domain-containing protein [Hyphomonas sp.]